MKRGTVRIWSGLLVAVVGLATSLQAQQPAETLPPTPIPVGIPGGVSRAGGVIPAALPPAVAAPTEATSPHHPPGLPPIPEPHRVDDHPAMTHLGPEQGEKEDGSWGFLADAEYLYMRARSRPLDYAIPSSNPLGGPVGAIQSVDWEWRSGFKVGAGVRLPTEGWEALFNYTYLHSSNNGRTASPPGGVLLPTLTHPGFVDVADTASGETGLNYNVFDVEFAKRIHAGETLDLRLFAGPRFANIHQGFDAIYDGRDAHNDQVHSSISFEGGGLRVGGEGTWHWTKGLGLYARGGASLVVGRVTSRLSEANNNGVSVITNVSDRFDKVIPVTEVGMGLSYQWRSLRVRVGYEFVNWFGLVDGIDFADDAHVGKYMRRTGDLSLDGLTLRAEWSY